MDAFAKLKEAFFDSPAVMAKVEKGKRRVLSSFGGYVRRVAKNSIKYRKATAPPGSPPSAHRSEGFTRTKKNRKTGAETHQASSPLKELIFYAYDSNTGTVVVGPVPFRGEAKAPALLEKGGQTTRIEKTKTRTLHYRPHPFMMPALQKSSPKFAQQLKGLIR